MGGGGRHRCELFFHTLCTRVQIVLVSGNCEVAQSGHGHEQKWLVRDGYITKTTRSTNQIQEIHRGCEQVVPVIEVVDGRIFSFAVISAPACRHVDRTLGFILCPSCFSSVRTALHPLVRCSPCICASSVVNSKSCVFRLLLCRYNARTPHIFFKCLQACI